MEKILVLDFGGQYNQLIARRVRDLKIYAEILPYTVPLEQIRAGNYKGIIFTGGPNSIYETTSPHYTPDILKLGIPILGICYGAQLVAWMNDGKIEHAEKPEFGQTEVTVNPSSLLFKDVPAKALYWMSHNDYISRAPKNYLISAWSAKCPVAAMENPKRRVYAVQFHPEVTHTEYGQLILHNFLYRICGCKGDWEMGDFINRTVQELRDQIGNRGVILGLSGGVDSSVAAALLSRAVGKQLTCVFVDQGLMRKNEGDMVEKAFKDLFPMNFVRIECQEEFLSHLKGVTDPEEKRNIIGVQFYEVFWKNVRELYNGGFFAQGTIYPDRIESGKGDAAKIKTHHNQVRMPEDIHFDGVIEPLKDLFKDEVRKVGESLGLPHELVWRQPFPGPGLGVRIIGEVTAERVRILQEADAVLRDEIEKSGYDRYLSQYFAVLPGIRTVGVMGDARTYSELIAIRAVTTDDFMTADWAKIPYDLLGRISTRIIGEVEGVNRVVYDISQKPPATVEWE